MKSNSKFFFGLSLGLVISFFAFNGNSFLNANSNPKNESITAPSLVSDESVDGKWTTMALAQPKIQAYTNFISEFKLPQNTSTGGYIKRTLLNDIMGFNHGNYIKYSFYYDGDGKIGLIFQSDKSTENGIITGSAAFCPLMCNYP